MNNHNCVVLYGPNWNLDRYRMEKPGVFERERWNYIVVHNNSMQPNGQLVRNELREHKPIPLQRSEELGVIAVFTLRQPSSTWRALIDSASQLAELRVERPLNYYKDGGLDLD